MKNKVSGFDFSKLNLYKTFAKYLLAKEQVENAPPQILWKKMNENKK